MSRPPSSNSLDPLLNLKMVERADRRRECSQAEGSVRDREKAAEQLAAQIERLASEMQASSKRSPINMHALRQLDTLTELLRQQQRELVKQAEEAQEVLQTCQDELQRADQSVKTFERLKEIRAADEQRRLRRAG